MFEGENNNMKLIRYALVGMCLAPLATACGDDGKSISEFEGYGLGMPGSALAEGGEALLEKMYLSPAITGGDAILINQFHAYHYTGSYMGATMFPAFDGCFEYDNDPVRFPVHEIKAAASDYADWGASVTLSGSGLPAAGVTVPKVVAPTDEGQFDNRPTPYGPRHPAESIIYGGPTWQGTAADFQASNIPAGGAYSLNVQNDEGEDLTFNMARSMTFTTVGGGVVGTSDHELPAEAPAGGLVVTWDPQPNPNTPHSRTHDFTFFAIAGGPKTIICNTPQDDDPGTATIPKAMYDANIADGGVVQQGRLTHYQDAVDGRKFDLFAIWCAVSGYAKAAP
jgi:hypothetical protein